MAEEIKTAEVQTTPTARFERDDLDPEGFDVNALPALPWTREALGADVFHALSTAMGAGDLRTSRRPSVDPRSFGEGRANRLIEAYGIGGLQKPDESNADYAARVSQAEAYQQEGLAIQEQIDAKLPKVTGSPRSPKAKPLTPTTTTIKQGGGQPRRL